MMAVASRSIRAWQLASGVMLWLFAIGAGAQQGNSLATWPRQVTTTITLGDGDSMARARTLAVERMRLEASAEVGALVATTAQLQDDRYSEQIKTLSVAFIKVNQVAESVSVDGQGRPALTVTARVDVDQGAVAQVLSNWSRDEAKSREIVRLQEENARLQSVMKQPRPIQPEPERRQSSGMTLNQALRNRADLPTGVEINPDTSAVSDQTKARITVLTSTLDALRKEKAALPSATASNGATMAQQWRLTSRIMDLRDELDRTEAHVRAESLRLSDLAGQ
jgi:hypothetical protein